MKIKTKGLIIGAIQIVTERKKYIDRQDKNTVNRKIIISVSIKIWRKYIVETSEEIPLSGGRITQGVVRRGDFVYRPCCSNSVFVHDVLKWLENKGITESPMYIGFTDDGREIISFLDGTSPNDLGWFNDNQLFEAGKIIKKLHDNLFDFPGCVVPSHTY
jgi:hypothetical protein